MKLGTVIQSTPVLAYIKFDYSASEVLLKLDQERYLKFTDRFPQFNLPDWPEGEDRPKYVYFSGKYLIDLAEDGLVLSELGIKFEITKFRNTYRPSAPTTEGDTNVNNVTNIHIPNIGLLAINHVMVLEDACTDQLQKCLTEGWSIIAVCPPNACRRPDYVLGRENRKLSA